MKETYYMISDAAKKVNVENHVLRYWEEELELPIKRNEMGHRHYTKEDIERFIRIKQLKEQGIQLKAIRSLLEKSEKNGEPFGTMLEDFTESGISGDKIGPGPFVQGAGEKAVDKERDYEADEIPGGSPDGGAFADMIFPQGAPETDDMKGSQELSGGDSGAETEGVRTQNETGLAEGCEDENRGGVTDSAKQKSNMSVNSSVSNSVGAARSEAERKAIRLQYLLKQLIGSAVRESGQELCDVVKESILKELDYQFRLQEEREESREKERCKREDEHFKKLDELLRNKSKREKRKKHSIF